MSFTDRAELPATNTQVSFKLNYLQIHLQTTPSLCPGPTREAADYSSLFPMLCRGTSPALLQVPNKVPRNATKHLPQQSTNPLLNNNNY